MKVFLKVFIFNLAVIAFFLYVANSIPQQRKDPPQELVLSADMAPADFVRAGNEIFYGKGTCALCHEIGKKGERCPDLDGVGARAETRIKEAGYKGTASNGAEYLVESLHNPVIYVVEGYQPSMPPLGRQLNDLEMVAVVSFLQSLGGEITVNGQTRFAKYRGEGGAEAAAQAPPAPAAPTGATPAAATATGKSGAELVQQWGCNTCHKFDGPERMVGPSLWDIGARQDVNYIRDSILQPDAVIAPGFPPQVMQTTLDGFGFYQKITLQDFKTLVDYLASLKGGQ
jgi:cytochrome c2